MAKAYYYKEDSDGTLYEFDKNKKFIPSEDVVFLWKGEGWDDSTLRSYGEERTAQKRSQLRNEYDYNVQKAQRELEQYRKRLADEMAQDYRDAYVDLRKAQSKLGDYASAAGMRGGAQQQRREQLMLAYEAALEKIRSEQARLLQKASQDRDSKIDDYEYRYKRELQTL